MIRSTDITDFYEDGRYLRRWSLVGGRARCVDDAYVVAATDGTLLAAQLTANAGLRATLAAVEAYEAALILAAQDEPPPTVEDDDGPLANPAWEAWSAAVALVGAADADTIGLADLRAGRVEAEPV